MTAASECMSKNGFCALTIFDAANLIRITVLHLDRSMGSFRQSRVDSLGAPIAQRMTAWPELTGARFAD